MTQELKVDLGTRSYPIYFSANGVDTQFAEFKAKGRGSVVVTDAGVALAQGQFIADKFGAAARIVLESGEGSKSMASFARVLDFLAENRISRQGVVWIFGGGVPGDLGGFAAASYLRGIDYIQIPTTLLAMVDSSVGGKTGLNLSAGKNLVGAFHHPRAVHISTEFLRTLPAREFAAGAAEVIKYGLLGDASLFAQLERNPITVQNVELPAVIRRCCEMKAVIVRDDEREQAKEGGRALLNLGHTFGHAIEQVTGYGTYLHGEAVAIGLAAAARLSRDLKYLSPADVSRIDRTLTAHVLPVRLRAPLPVASLMTAMQHDKKVRTGQLRFVVMKRLGEAATQDGIAAAAIEPIWRDLGAV